MVLSCAAAKVKKEKARAARASRALGAVVEASMAQETRLLDEERITTKSDGMATETKKSEYRVVASLGVSAVLTRRSRNKDPRRQASK